MSALNKEELERYSRHLLMPEFGPEAQQKLKSAKVLVVGAGGLGCPALLYLNAAGVGTIGIADDDKVSLSNLQRQVLFNTSDIGNVKCEVARERLAKLNPNTHVIAYAFRVNSENVLELLRDYDVVIDGTDNFNAKYLLNDACIIAGKPLIYGAIYRFEGQVSVFNYKEGPTYRCIFPEPPAEGGVLSCDEAGVLGVLPGIVGMWQATETIKIITDIGEPLSGKLLTFDLLKNIINTFNFALVPGNRNISSLSNYSIKCDSSGDISAKELDALIKDNYQLIDVRERNEYSAYNIGGKNIPMSELRDRLDEIEQRPAVLICRSGHRSKIAIEVIRQSHPNIKLVNLRNGILALKESL